MNSLAAKFSTKADPVEVFIERAKARACLVREGDFDLHDAVDGLQAAAEETGVLDALGQDGVQAIMAEAFAVVRASTNVDDAPDLDRAGYLDQRETSQRSAVAKSTIDAAEYLVRWGDADGLCRFLAAHTREERIGIRKHLEAKR